MKMSGHSSTDRLTVFSVEFWLGSAVVGMSRQNSSDDEDTSASYSGSHSHSQESQDDGSKGEEENSDSSYFTDDENPEMLTLNLAFGSKTDTLQVHWNDDPEDLAKMFVKKHGLKATSVSRICDHISEVIKQYKLENSELRPQSPTLGSLNLYLYSIHFSLSLFSVSVLTSRSDR
jgi:hypothetical protein